MKHLIILCLIVIITAGAGACVTETSSPASPSQGTPLFTGTPPANGKLVVPAPIAPPGFSVPGMPSLPGRENVYSVQIDLVPSKVIYMPGEQVQMELILTNASQGKVEPVIVSPLPPSISLIASGSVSGPAIPPGITVPGLESGKSVSVKTFPAGTEERKLTVGEKVTYNLTWNQKDEAEKQVSPGWYYYEAYYNFRQESSKEGVGSGIRDRAFLIQYPQGAMQKTIELNQSRTITGLPLTVDGGTKSVDLVINLQRVELNEKGATFYVTMSSPNNPVSGYNNLEWLGRGPMSAQYVIDGVVKEARAPSRKFLDSGIEFRWGASVDDDNYLDPVSADAKELTFVIPKIGPDWQGPWEFALPLEQ